MRGTVLVATTKKELARGTQRSVVKGEPQASTGTKQDQAMYEAVVVNDEYEDEYEYQLMKYESEAAMKHECKAEDNKDEYEYEVMKYESEKEEPKPEYEVAEYKAEENENEYEVAKPESEADPPRSLLSRSLPPKSGTLFFCPKATATVSHRGLVKPMPRRMPGPPRKAPPKVPPKAPRPTLSLTSNTIQGTSQGSLKATPKVPRPTSSLTSKKSKPKPSS